MERALRPDAKLPDDAVVPQWPIKVRPSNPAISSNESLSRRRTALFLVTHSGGGGVQEIWANIAEGLLDRGFDADLLALYPHADSVPAGSGRLRWQHLADYRPSSLGGQLALLRSLVRVLRERSAEVVFTAMPAANVLAPVAALLAQRKVQVVISHHTPIGTYNHTLRALDGLTGLLPSVAAIVSVSKAVEASLDGRPSRYGAKRMTIRNALPPYVEDLLQALDGERRRNGRRGRRVVATGRLAPQKNYPALLRAAARLPDVTFAIVGTGPEEAALQALARELGLGERVRFLGHRPRDEALALLAAGDIFAQPSLFEGHSLGLIEAAKLGMPLVVSDVPVQIEGITAPCGERCGIAVDPREPAALADAIRRLLDDPGQYEHWTVRARQLAASSSFDAMLSAYAALVLNNGGEGSPDAPRRGSRR